VLLVFSFDNKSFNSFIQICSADYVVFPELRKSLRKAIGRATTLHALGTQPVVLAGESTVEATSYWSVSHYLRGKSFFAEARYFDKLIRVIDGDGEGKWLIESRYVNTMGVPKGDVSIFGLELEWVYSLKG
jgi:hypothetical protein